MPRKSVKKQATEPLQRPAEETKPRLPPEEVSRVAVLFSRLVNSSKEDLSKEQMYSLLQEEKALSKELEAKYGAELGGQIERFGQFQALLEAGVDKDLFKELAAEVLPDGLALQPQIPVFNPPKSVEVKKEFSLNFGNINRIEKEFPRLLPKKLASGKTLQQHLDEVRHWFDDLHGEDLGMWVKLFAFVKAVREEADKNKALNFKITGPNRYLFEVNANKDFYNFFLLPDKKMKRHTTKAKEKLVKWLYDNQKSVTFPIIINKQVWAAPIQIFTFMETVDEDSGRKRFVFMVDTNILDSKFEDYISINIHEVDETASLWNEYSKANPDFAKYQLSSFEDLPLKFLFALKQIYNPGGNFTNGTYQGNVQKLTRANLDSHLGDLDERLAKHAVKTRITRAKDGGQKIKDVKTLILTTIFSIAVDRGWLMSMPSYAAEEEVYTFNLNAGYFAPKNTAKRLLQGRT